MINLQASQSESHGHGTKWPENLGILAMEVYFPSTFVCQEKLECFDGASKGKYTIGLGQEAMGFCSDREDVCSLSLTVVHGLLERYKIDRNDIGRLEVGTETIIDKSKSVKTVLMQLFEDSGNTSIEGIDTTNACYGGTAALFNALNWIESSSWDGRLAIVVMADIAVYAAGNARCTGGAGAIALLIGPDAPLVIDRGLRSTHMQHVYDFYKPDMGSEYAVVDGRLSVKCYLGALDKCYQRFGSHFQRLIEKEEEIFTLDKLDYFVFHTPFCKMVQKSLARCMLNDYLKNSKTEDQEFHQKYEKLIKYRSLKLEDTFADDSLLKEVERASVDCCKETFSKLTKQSLLLAQKVGNMYTPSLYGSLASLLMSASEEELVGKRVALFSYGSGLAASMFSISICPQEILRPRLTKMLEYFKYVSKKLSSRVEIEPTKFVDVLAVREKTHHLPNYAPVGSIEQLFPGTYYLTRVDEKFRRFYERNSPIMLPSCELI